MKSTYLVLMLAAMFVVSCGEKKAGDLPDGTTTAPPGSRFGVKAGMAEITMEMMGMKTDVVTYWDDFGGKSITQVSGEMMGMKLNETSIDRDGYSIKFDAEKKTGTKAPSAPNDEMKFLNLTPEQLKERGLTKVGTESFLGKECTVYEIDSDKISTGAPSEGQQMDVKGKVWVWQGIPMKMEVGELMKMEATKVEVLESVPASKFEVPADVTITEDAGMSTDSVVSPH